MFLSLLFNFFNSEIDYSILKIIISLRYILYNDNRSIGYKKLFKVRLNYYIHNSITRLRKDQTIINSYIFIGYLLLYFFLAMW